MHYIQIVHFASIEIKVKSATDLWAAILNIYTAEKRSEIIYPQGIRKYNWNILSQIQNSLHRQMFGKATWIVVLRDNEVFLLSHVTPTVGQLMCGVWPRKEKLLSMQHFHEATFTFQTVGTWNNSISQFSLHLTPLNAERKFGAKLKILHAGDTGSRLFWYAILCIS